MERAPEWSNFQEIFIEKTTALCVCCWADLLYMRISPLGMLLVGLWHDYHYCFRGKRRYFLGSRQNTFEEGEEILVREERKQENGQPCSFCKALHSSLLIFRWIVRTGMINGTSVKDFYLKKNDQHKNFSHRQCTEYQKEIRVQKR